MISLNESLKKIITEGAESRNMGLAKHYLYDKKGMDEASAMKTLGMIKTNVPNVRLAKCKFILGAARMYCNGELSDGANISMLNKYLRYIASEAHVNEYDQNLNGLSLEGIDERFGTIATNDLDAEKETFSKQNFSLNNDYDIVPIDSFEDASEYSQYTDWCVTEDPTMYENYTSGGLGRFYFCLKKGFENVPMEKGDNCPLDEYGLSMIATSVNSDGSCNTITCRWNHNNGGNDSIMDTKGLSELIGRNYYDVFKPYTKEDIMERAEKKATNLLLTYNDYTSSDVDEAIEYINDMSNHYDIDDNCYYDDDGYEMDYDSSLVDSVKERDDIKPIDDELSLIAYAGFCDDSDLVAEDAPCIMIRTEDNARIGKGLFSFDHHFNMWGNYVSAPIYTGSKAEPKLVILDYLSNEYISNDSFDIVKEIKRNKLGWVAIVSKNGLGSNVLNNDGTFLFKDWIVGDISSMDYGNLYIADSNNKRYITNSNGDVMVSDISKGSNVSKAIFKPFSSGQLFYFITHTNGIINTYDEKTFKKFAPWDIKELLGEKGIQVHYKDSNGASCGKLLWLYQITLTSGERCFLDKKANMYDLNGNMIKKNPFYDSSAKPSWIEESVKRYLLEGIESRNMGLAKHYLYDRKGADEPTAMSIIGAIKKNIPNARLAKCKYMLGIVRLYLNNELSNAESIMKINQYLKYIASNAHVNEYDNNLNGLSFEKIDEVFGQVATDDLDADKSDLASQKYTANGDYEIIPIDTPEEAAKYSQYTSWCITQDSGAYYDYTHGANGRFYFCLKNGFERVEKIQGSNCPLDEYGLSMIAVSVNADGSCNTITCRWNHDNDGNDHIMTPKELSSVIGRNFYDVFKPFSESEIKDRYNHIIKDALNKFNDSYENIYDAYSYSDVTCIIQGASGRYDNIDIGVYEIAPNSQCILIKSNSNEPLIWKIFDRFSFDRSGDILTVPASDEEYALLGMDGKYITNDKFRVVNNHAALGYIIVMNDDGKSNVLVSKNIGKDVSNGWEYMFDEWLDGKLVTSRDYEYFILRTPTEEDDGLCQLYTLDGRKVASNISDIKDIRYTKWLIVKKDKFYYFVNRKTFKISAPWQMRKVFENGYGFFKVSLKDNRIVNVDSRTLDILNPINGQVMKKNPYNEGNFEESFKCLGNMIKESLDKMLSDAF